MHMCHVCVVVYRHIYWSLKLLYYFLCSILCFTNKNLTHVHLFNQMLIFCLFIFQTFSFLKNQNKKPTHVHQPPSPVHHHFTGSTKKRSPTLSSVIHYCRQVHTSAGQPVTQKKKRQHIFTGHHQQTIHQKFTRYSTPNWYKSVRNLLSVL